MSTGEDNFVKSNKREVELKLELAFAETKFGDKVGCR